MAKNVYIRIFDTHAEYEAFLNSDEFIRPNVSYCKDRNYEVHYNPLEPEPPVPPVSEGTITCLYEVEEAGRVRLYGYQNSTPSTSATYGLNNFSEMRIDGGEWIPAEMYTELSAGIHTVEFKMIDNTLIERGTFSEYGEGYDQLYALREVTIPDTVTQIIYHAFDNKNIAKITFEGTTPPDLIAWTPPNGQWFGGDNPVLTYPIYVPGVSIMDYKNKENWDMNNYTERIQAS